MYVYTHIHKHTYVCIYMTAAAGTKRFNRYTVRIISALDFIYRGLP